MADKKVIAAFDFDGTLIKGDSLFITARHVLGQRKMLWALVRALPAIARWMLHLGGSNSQAKQKLISNFYKGMPAETLARAGRELIPVFDSLARDTVMQEFEEHLKAGHVPVIVTASLGDWVRPWAKEKGFHTVIATEPEADADGLLTGRFRTPNCHGAEKVTCFLEQFPDRDAYTLWAYGDSSGDEQLLSIADYPVFCGKDSRR